MSSLLMRELTIAVDSHSYGGWMTFVPEWIHVSDGPRPAPSTSADSLSSSGLPFPSDRQLAAQVGVPRVLQRYLVSA